MLIEVVVSKISNKKAKSSCARKRVLLKNSRRKTKSKYMATAPHRPKGPPLNALRAFEAAARLGGFASAADELCVTPGAISQHVKALEEWAGAHLFNRRSQGVVLTPLGEHVAAEFSTVFDQMGQAVQTLRSQAAPEKIHIAALPSIAQLWLLPRLPGIRLAVPDALISVTTMEHRPNFRREPFDFSIFFEERPAPAGSIKICDEAIYPVCAPSIASRLTHPRDLAVETFLHDAAWSADWDLWLEAALPNVNVDTSGPIFSLYSLALEEAKNGAGVLIGHEPLVSALLESGDLIAPFKKRISINRELSILFADPEASSATINDIVRAIAAGGSSHRK